MLKRWRRFVAFGATPGSSMAAAIGLLQLRRRRTEQVCLTAGLSK